MSNQCKILYWDQEYRVRGMVAGQSRQGLHILRRIEATPGTPFRSQLAEVYLELKSHRAEAVLLGGFLPEFIIFELEMPKLDRTRLQSALELELPRRLPALREGMQIAFRVLPSGEASPRLKLRVFAVRSRVIHELFDQFREAGLKMDAFCHPLMTVQLTSEQPVVRVPRTAPGLALELAPDGLAGLRIDETAETADVSGETLAAYALGREFQEDQKTLSPLPDELRFRRFKKSRNFAILLLSLSLLAGGLLLFRHWQQQDRRIRAYRRAIQLLDSRLRAHRKQLEDEQALNVFAVKMLETLDAEPILPLLGKLSGKLPPNVWLTGLRAGNGRVALTLSATGDSGMLGTALNELDGWTVENQRQQQESGAEVWYVTLRRSQP